MAGQGLQAFQEPLIWLRQSWFCPHDEQLQAVKAVKNQMGLIFLTREKFVDRLWVNHTHSTTQVCPGGVGCICFCLIWLGLETKRDTGVKPKPPVSWWVHSLWRSSPLLAQVVGAPGWCVLTCSVLLDLVRVCRSYISANQNTYKLIAVVSLAYLPKQSSNHLYRTPKSEVSFAQGETLLRSSLFQNLRGSFCDLKFYLWPCQDFTSSEMQSKIGSGHLYKHAEIIHICAGQF